jgi:8-oxo-dGTP diphosphatase
MSTNTKKVGVGVGVMIFSDGKVLLRKRHQDPQKASSLLHGEGTWTMPGGKLDFGESFEQGACREVFEETGIKLSKEKLKVISISNDIVEDAHFVTIGLFCDNFDGGPKVMEPDEIVKWKWFLLDDLPDKIFFRAEKF